MATTSVPFGQAEASRFARLALGCVQKEYPNKLDHVISDAGRVQGPRALHPAFYGCFDWHSSVHSHWTLVRLLKTFPVLAEAAEIRTKVSQNLSPQNLAGELAYLKRLDTEGFERTYGWAWLLKLAEELHGWEDSDGASWSDNLRPLADAFARRYSEFLPKQKYPIRAGVHPNTAFGLAFAWDYATTTGEEALAGLIRERSTTYFARDTDYPAAWEPSSEDFLSPSLVEADLMRRVMEPDEFSRWFHHFLPGSPEGQPETLMHPVDLSDRSDPKLVHLDGLNLSRAWCMRSIAGTLSRHDPARRSLADAATRHAAATLEHVASGDYAGEHWLGSFAVYMLSTPDPAA